MDTIEQLLEWAKTAELNTPTPTTLKWHEVYYALNEEGYSFGQSEGQVYIMVKP